MSEVVVRAQGVTLRRGKTVIVPALALEVPRGSLFGLVGPSGSGKTTIMRAMLGLGGVHAGSLTVLDRPAGAPALRREIGYLPQNGGTWLDLTARENLQFMARVYGSSEESVDATLRLMELDAMADRPIATFSGGQERRVGLGMALLHEPPLLILDEPTVGLDPRLRHKLWQEFHQWAREGRTLIVSTHVMDEAAECDVIAVLIDGGIVAYGSPAEIMARTDTHDLERAILALLIPEEDHVA